MYDVDFGIHYRLIGFKLSKKNIIRKRKEKEDLNMHID